MVVIWILKFDCLEVRVQLVNGNKEEYMNNFEVFSDEELINEVIRRGYNNPDEKSDNVLYLTKEEKDVLSKMIDSSESPIGSDLYYISEKLVNGT